MTQQREGLGLEASPANGEGQWAFVCPGLAVMTSEVVCVCIFPTRAVDRVRFRGQLGLHLEPPNERDRTEAARAYR